jgi:two-component system LytT family response regulator
MKIRTLLIDDELLARDLTKKFLEAEESIEIIAEAADGFEGMKLIQSLSPDLIFLDIQMPKLTGLEMLELIPNPPVTVFATAYDQYAIEAFEKNAVDYLLKPFSKDRLLKTLEKVKEKINKPEEQKVQQLLQSYQPGSQKRVVLKNGSKIEMIPHEDIHYVESYGDYVWLHTGQNKHLKQKTMKEFEILLGPDFLRIHRSYLVNARSIEKMELYERSSYLLLLKNGHKLTVSKTGYKILRDHLGW